MYKHTYIYKQKEKHTGAKHTLLRVCIVCDLFYLTDSDRSWIPYTEPLSSHTTEEDLKKQTNKQTEIVWIYFYAKSEYNKSKYKIGTCTGYLDKYRFFTFSVCLIIVKSESINPIHMLESDFRLGPKHRKYIPTTHPCKVMT